MGYWIAGALVAVVAAATGTFALVRGGLDRAGLDFGMTPEDVGLWFGILTLIVVEVGLISPPFGLNIFVINAMARDVPFVATWRGVLPFVAADIVRIGLLLALPPLALALVWWTG